MELENTVQQTTEQNEELDLNAFDEGWGDVPSEDDGFELEADEPQEVDTGTPTEEGDGDTTEQAEAETGAQEEADNAGAQENTEGHQLYTLKHLGKEGLYTIDEVLEFAGKGMDYDGVRQDRDELRRERAALNGQTEFLKELAKRAGDATIEQHLDRVRATWSIQDAEKSGNVVSPEDALIRATQTRLTAAEPEPEKEPEAEQPKPAEQQEKPAEDESAAQRAQMFRAFIAEYPGVKPEDIPKEVWTECARTGDLAGAYRKHENAKLKAELEELKLNQRNKERSTGSWQSAGAPTPKDAFDEGWDSV